MKSILKLLEDLLIVICKYAILTGRYLKKHIARIACYVMTIAIMLSGYFIGSSHIESYFEEESVVQALAKADAEVLLQEALTAKEEKRVAEELARIEAERKEAERIEAERKEAERIEAERKEAERIAAEKEKQRKREEAAKAEALRKEVIAA
ncbi:MAG: hypothetical protein RR444_07365, partial [Oscillospiraceae bacterium]